MATAPTKYGVPDLSGDIASLKTINPKAYAASSVNATYTPQINNLVRALLAQQKGVKGNQGDISNWYGHIANMYKSAAADDTAYGDAASKQLADSLGGLTGNLDGAAASHVGALSAILEGQQAKLNRNDNHFLTEMRPAIGLQGAQAHVDEQKLGQQYGGLIAGRIADTRAAKGADYRKALQDAIQMGDQESVARINAKATAALLPGQIDAAGLANDTATENLTRAQQMDPILLRQANATINKTIAEAKAKGHGGLNLQDPSQLAAVNRALRHAAGVDGPAGVFKYDPSAAYENELSALDQAGLTKNPTAIKLAQSIAAESVRTAHAKRAWGQYYVAPDGTIKLDRTRARYVQPKKK